MANVFERQSGGVGATARAVAPTPPD